MADNKKHSKEQEVEKKPIDNQQEAPVENAAAEENAAAADDKSSAQDDALAAKVGELQASLDKKNDEYLRLMAEFDNFRRRTSRERLDLIAVAGEDIIKGILPVVDDFERALAVLDSSDAMAAAKEGTALIYNKLVDYLKSKGLAEIECVGKPLDTDYHEAVAQIPAPAEENKGLIFDVAQKGYTLNGKVIRFAKVVVAI